MFSVNKEIVTFVCSQVMVSTCPEPPFMADGAYN